MLHGRPRSLGRRGDDAAPRCIASELVGRQPAEQIVFGCIVTILPRRRHRLSASSTASSSSTAACSRSSRRSRPAPSPSASRCSSGRSRAARSTSTSTGSLTNSLARSRRDLPLFDDGEAAWFQPIAWFPVPRADPDRRSPLLVWVPFRRTVTGRTRLRHRLGRRRRLHVRACRSTAPSSRPSRSAGFFAGCGGLYLAIQTCSGNADIPQAGAYTLNSIAAVVLGGMSLLGGVGRASAR